MACKRKIFFFSSPTVLIHSQAGSCSKDRHGHTCFPYLHTAKQNGQLSDTWQRLLTMQRWLTSHGWRQQDADMRWVRMFKHTSNNSIRSREKPPEISQWICFTIFFLLSQYKKINKYTCTHTHTWLLPDLQLKGCSSLLCCLPLNLACFPF